MAILLVLLILTLGYTYASSVPMEHNKLKRSDGWESYVYLAKHGLTLLIGAALRALIITVLLLLLLTLVEYILAKIGRTIYIDVNNLYEAFKSNNMLETNVLTVWMATYLIVFLAWQSILKILKNQGSYKHLDQLRKEDSVLNIIIESIIKNETVKISLKSRKIYIGLVHSEQFETLDLDNIVIIPFVSGYRDKNDLKMKLDCNYIPVYKKNGIVPSRNLNQEHMEKLESFRLAVKMEEVESISLFSYKHYQQFELFPSEHYKQFEFEFEEADILQD